MKNFLYLFLFVMAGFFCVACGGDEAVTTPPEEENNQTSQQEEAAGILQSLWNTTPLSPQDNEQGYIFGDDRAELVLNAIVKFHPIKKLTVGIGYQLRSRRSLMFTDVNGMWYKQELQDVNSLKLGANYRLNDIVGFFVELDNLLNKRWDTHYGMGTQPLGVMGGVSLLF